MIFGFGKKNGKRDWQVVAGQHLLPSWVSHAQGRSMSNPFRIRHRKPGSSRFEGALGGEGSYSLSPALLLANDLMDVMRTLHSSVPFRTGVCFFLARSLPRVARSKVTTADSTRILARGTHRPSCQRLRIAADCVNRIHYILKHTHYLNLSYFRLS